MKTIKYFFLACLLSLAVPFLWPKPPLLADVNFSRAVFDDQGHLLRLTLSQDEKYRLYVPLAKIAPQLVEATLLQEDQYYRWHFGVNPIALLKAGWQTYIVKSRRIGASTIAMQVARIRFNINSRQFSGKILQILRALQLEMHYSKNQILEAYLNLAPYGNNIEGVGAASLIYFGKPVDKLTLPEALTLSIIPQNPTRRTPQQKNLKEIRNKLFARWVAQHPHDRNQQATINLPLQMQTIHNLPFLAPHFVNTILNTTPAKQQSIQTTLDIPLQRILERVTHSYLARKKSVGAYNAAVLLVDTRDMSVKGLVGSNDFFNSAISGQINGTETKRSPGSALKPFIYGLAFDQGLIHPDTILKDVPHSFGNYNPENFDYDFLGPVKARDALILSRNIPAIFLANQLSHPSLYELLEAAHVSHLKSENYYGLALALGGAEISAQELTSLYAMLANQGVWYPLRMRLDEPRVAGTRLLSPEASFLVLDILKNTTKPDAVSNLQIPVAWKTGTSSGFRDAWSVGVFGPYVLTVWVGNFNNASNPAFIGKEMAAPLLFEMIEAISHEKGVLPLLNTHPENLHLTEVAVCKASGMLPTRYCPDTEMTWFIPGKSPIKTDTIYREIPIDSTTGLRTCHINSHTRFEVFEFWPSDLLKIFKQAGIARRTPPAYDGNCFTTNAVGIAPEITSPQTQLSYIVRTDTPLKNTIPLAAVTDADVKDIYWFVNETYLGKTHRDQTFWWTAKPGKFVIRVVDDHERSDARDIEIKGEI